MGLAEAQLQFRHPARVKLNCLPNIMSVVILKQKMEGQQVLQK